MTALIDGHALLLHLDNGNEAKTLLSARFNREERDFLTASVPQDDGVFVDVGANAGLFSFHVACRARRDCRILLVEANPAMTARCRAHVLPPGRFDPRAVAIAFETVAVGAEEGEAYFAVTDDPGTSHLAQVSDAGARRVPVTTLPRLFDTHGITRVDCLKIDVEGHEDAVLAPLLDAGDTARLPAALILEDIHDGAWGYDLSASLANAGYRVVGRSRTNVMMRREGAG